jgi:hypothetical protein
MELFEPQIHEDRPMRAARCPGKPGNMKGLSSLHIPEITAQCKPLLGHGGALPKIVRALRRGLTPKETLLLADQFHAAASAARNTAAVDEIARLTWRAHAEGQLQDAEAEAISECQSAPKRDPPSAWKKDPS